MNGQRRQGSPDTRPLDVLRDKIDRVDDALVGLIQQRLDLAVAAAESKAMCGLELRDVGREAEVIRRVAARARELGLDDEPVRELFWRLIDLSHRTVGREQSR